MFNIYQMMLESANVEIQSNEKDIELNTEREKQKDTQSSLTKLTYIILIYVFYIFGGLFNEKLTKNE